MTPPLVEDYVIYCLECKANAGCGIMLKLNFSTPGGSRRADRQGLAAKLGIAAPLGRIALSVYVYMEICKGSASIHLDRSLCIRIAAPAGTMLASPRRCTGAFKQHPKPPNLSQPRSPIVLLQGVTC